MSNVVKQSENSIFDSEYYTSYAALQEGMSDVPLWWKRDIPVKLTKRERLKEIKRQISVNLYINSQVKSLKKQNEDYARKRSLDEQKFQKEIMLNAQLLQLKLQEIQLAADQNAEVLLKELNETQSKLEEVKRQRLRADAELKHEQQTNRKQAQMLKRLDEIKKTLNIAEDDLQQQFVGLQDTISRKDELKRANQAIDIDDDKIKGSMQKRYEEYDIRNAIELRDIFFKRKYENDFIFKGINIFIKRNMNTVIFADSMDRLSYIKQLLFRNYPSDFHVVQGVVRILGKEAGSVPKTEYKDVFGGILDSFTNTSDALKRCKSTLKSFLKDNYNESAIKGLYEFFGLPTKLISSRLVKLNEETIDIISLIALAASTKAIKIYESPEDALESGVMNTLISLLNQGNYGTSVILTTSLEIANNIIDAKVYKI